MKKLKFNPVKKLSLVLFIALVLTCFQCTPLFYYSQSIYAHVYDEKSGEPLENVIVVAFWKLDGGLEGGSNEGVVQVMETLTDKNGRFDFPSWGPKGTPKGA